MLYSETLKSLRESKELIQENISNILGIERGVYSLYETEYKIMPIKHLNTICNYFNVSLDYIFGFTNITNYKKSILEINKKETAQRLKEIRKENKLTQNKLAQMLNIANGTIAEYERGTNIIATPFLYTVCKKYNISADYLLGKTDSPKYLN